MARGLRFANTMERYMIRLVDTALPDWLSTICWSCLSKVGTVVGHEHVDRDLQRRVMDALVRQFRLVLHAYAACGTAPTCDSHLEGTLLAPPGGPVRGEGIPPRSNRILRYHLELAVPLARFMRRVEAAVLGEVARRTPGCDWKPRMFLNLQGCIEPLVGRYLYHSEPCGYLCSVAPITEYDPWVGFEGAEPATRTGIAGASP